jgi:flagellar basal-body rod protein FlgB
MESNGIFSPTVSLLQRALDLRSQRHRAIVSNIANIDTPNYKSFDVLVEEALQRKTPDRPTGAPMARSHPLHRNGVPSAVNADVRRIEDGDPTGFRGDGNTVDLDREMAKLASNQLYYDAAAQIVAMKFRSLKTAISGGKP